MNNQTQNEGKGVVIAIKAGALHEQQGFLRPVLKEGPNGEYEPINRENYPKGIFVSKGYDEIDSRFDADEFILLKNHYLSEEMTQKENVQCYWTTGELATAVTPTVLLPIIHAKLPPKETCALPAEVHPPTGTFFLQEDSKLYGPMTCTMQDDRAILEPVMVPSLSYGRDNLGCFDFNAVEDSIVSLYQDGREQQYVKSITHIAKFKTNDGYIDFISDDRLIKDFNRRGTGKKHKLSKREAEVLQSSVSAFERSNAGATGERFERLKGLLDRYLNEADSGREAVNDYLNSSEGKQFLHSYTEANQERLLSKEISKIRNLHADIQEKIHKKTAEMQQQLERLESDIEFSKQRVIDERAKADEDIERIKAETKENARKKLEEEAAELAELVAQKHSESEKIQQDIEKGIKTLNKIKHIDELNSEISYLERHKDTLKDAASAFEKTMTTHPEEMAKKLAEMEVVTRVLKGGKTWAEDNSSEKLPIDFASRRPESKTDLIDSLCAYFEVNSGKKFSAEEMANLVISIQQSFLTVIAGQPGVGKTSSVIRLAEALGIGGPDGRQNFLYVPVGRGWVSGRDTLGFYNSLKGVYQSSRTGIYDFLRRGGSAEKASKIILLDEANLSPMEHYWSDFLGMCDPEGRMRPLDTGIPGDEKRYLSVGEQVRFIATINKDSTTERLSPRLIDRVPVITIEGCDTQNNTSTSIQTPLDGALEYKQLSQFFMPEEDVELSNAEVSALSRVIECLEKSDNKLGQQITISARKQLAITAYCSVAKELIGSNGALDFAISQHILPHIDGHGAKFRERLNILLEEFDNKYPRSERLLERIISGGDAYTGSYSFF